MYEIKSGNTTLHHPLSDSGEIATAAEIAEELNTQGSLNMKLNDLRGLRLRDPVEVYDDDGIIWRGRVIGIDRALSEFTRAVHCEGALAFLCDTILPPFSFRGTPADMFRAIISHHNDMLPTGDPRRFTVGSVTVTDPNNYIHRSSESAMTTWDAIKTRLLDLSGGYIYLSGRNLDTVNYVADFTFASNQTIHFGENLVELAQAESGADIVTVLDAYGARLDNPTGEPTGTGLQLWDGDRLHLSALLPYQAAVTKWGRIVGTQTFDDITLMANLQTAAGEWLIENFLQHLDSLEVTAADLSLIDASIDKLNVGNYVHVICEPLSIDQLMLCVRKTTNLIDVSQTTVSIGRAPVTLSGMIGGT